MGKQRPSLAGPAGASVMFADLEKVEEQARKLQGDLDEAERKEREDLEREKQLAAWQVGVDDAKRELPNKRHELVDQEKLVLDLGREQRDVDEAMKAADKDAKKDLYAQQKRLADDIGRAKKEVNRLRDQIRSLETQQAENFVFRPPVNVMQRATQPTGRFVPPSSNKGSTTPIPDDKLPEVGALRVLKNQRYLVIQTWEELTNGERAAERLAANLVAAEEV